MAAGAEGDAVGEVEVLTVHFEKQTMRVRFMVDNYGVPKVTTQNISAAPFFEKYGLVEDRNKIEVSDGGGEFQEGRL